MSRSRWWRVSGFRNVTGSSRSLLSPTDSCRPRAELGFEFGFGGGRAVSPRVNIATSLFVYVELAYAELAPAGRVWHLRLLHVGAGITRTYPGKLGSGIPCAHVMSSAILPTLLPIRPFEKKIDVEPCDGGLRVQ